MERITLGGPDGIEIDPCVYNKRTVYRNTTVEIFENTETGECSIGWYKQDNTEEVEE